MCIRDRLSAEIIGSQSAPQCLNSYYIRENNRLTIGKNNKVTESEMWQRKIEEIMEFQGRQAQETITLEAVSYTHLDVYKRQEIVSSKLLKY